MNDGIGSVLRDYVTGDDATFSDSTYNWIKFNSPDKNLEICEA